MMIYNIIFEKKADEDIQKLRRSGNKTLLKKLAKILDELQEHPRTGTGQVEKLKHQLYPETWSRRLSKEHRIVYEIHDDKVVVKVLSTLGHYEDK